MTTLAEALSSKSEADVLLDLFAGMDAYGVDAAGFPAFSVPSALAALDARALAHEQAIRVALVKAGFGDLAASAGDEWVDLLVYSWYQRTRVAATAARWLFNLTASVGAGTISATAGELIAVAGEVQFTNIAALQVPDGQTIPAEFVAITKGATGNIFPGTIEGFVVGKSGLSVSNPASGLLYAGRDAERNAAYIARGRAQLAATSSGGSRDAYLAWAVEAFVAAGYDPTITKIAVDDTNPRGPGTTDLYVANAAGPATPTEIEVLNDYLQPRRGLGTGSLLVIPAPFLVVPVVAALYVDGNEAAVAQATARLAQLQADIPLGGGPKGYLYQDTIRGLWLGPDGVVGVYKVDMISPSSDLKLSSPFQGVQFAPTLTRRS
jgi:hypothetical protein